MSSTPVWIPSYPRIGSIYDRSAEIVASTNIDSTLYYVTTSDVSYILTSEYVKAGMVAEDNYVKAGLSGTAPILQNQKTRIIANNLIPESNYYIWTVAENDLQAEPVPLYVTTHPTTLVDDPDKIHYQVTRPQVPIIDTDGQGNYNISPVGFPVHDESTYIGVTPTRVNPKFKIPYSQDITSVAYTEMFENITPLEGLERFSSPLKEITINGSNVAMVTTARSHGFKAGTDIIIAGTPNTFDGTYTIANVTDTTLYFSFVASPTTVSLTGTASYQSQEHDVITLTNQTIKDENGSYNVKVNSWQEIAITCKSNTTVNMDLNGIDDIDHTLTSIIGDGVGTVTAITEKWHGMRVGNYITISGVSPFNGTYVIAGVKGDSFTDGDTFTYDGYITGSDSSGTATFTPSAGDFINVNNQSNSSENGIYYVNASTDWSFNSACYKYDGTENDNLPTEYGTDLEGNPIQHFRQGYSHEEISDFIKERLDTTIEFGRYRGDKRTDHGALVRWLLGGRKVNIGGDGADKEIFVDPFGCGDPVTKLSRTYGEVDPLNNTYVSAKQTEISRLNKYTRWGISNNHNVDPVETLGYVKAPTLRDYPFIYNSEGSGVYVSGLPDADVDIDSWYILTNGSSHYIGAGARPLSQNVTYYQKENAYHNNITLDTSQSTMMGRHHISIIHDLEDTNATYDNEAIKTSLDDMVDNDGFATGIHIVKRDTEGNVIKYRFKQRKKNSLADIIPKTTGWTETTLTYDSSSATDIKIYLESTETDYLLFSHPTKTTAELLQDLKDNNDLIPETFDPITVNADSLTELFSYNTLIDYSNAVHQGNKSRSKKTFIHLATPISLPDGQLLELDVSLPIDPTSDPFPYSTVGGLSGYRNFVSQPRAFVLSGGHTCSATDLTTTSTTRVDNAVSVVTTADHEIYTYTFATTDVDVTNNYITVSDVDQFAVGGAVKFSSSGTLPPELSTGTEYTIEKIDEDRIRLTGITLTGTGTGTHKIVNLRPVRIIVKGATQDDYNGEFDATVRDVNSFSYYIAAEPTTPATGTIKIDKIVSAPGKEGAEGLTERNNSEIFGVMPEAEFATDGNLYNQTFTPSKLDSDDKRVLIASVYPTSTNTFQWRIDNDPQLRMLKWSLFGMYESYGSASHVAYNRNKAIVDEFSVLYSSVNIVEEPLRLVTTTTRKLQFTSEHQLVVGSILQITNVTAGGSGIEDLYEVGDYITVTKRNSDVEVEFDSGNLLTHGSAVTLTVKHQVFDSTMAENPLTYTASTYASDHSESYFIFHILHYYLRVQLPDTLVPETTADLLSSDIVETTASYNYQALRGYTDLVSDFYRGRVLIASDGDDVPSTFDTTAQSFTMGHSDNNTNTDIPSGFYDSFIEYNTTELPHSTNENGVRWITKGIYSPDYVVNAQTATNQEDKDVYEDTSSVLKLYLGQYFIDAKERESNAGFRYVPGDINPLVDPSFEFSVGYREESGSISRLLDTLMERESDNNVLINDVRRSFWDSYFRIPQGVERNIQNRVFIEGIATPPHQYSRFYGFAGTPFTKIFSTDFFSPSENSITTIDDYAAIRGGTWPLVENTLENAIKSNPIADKFYLESSYLDGFASINSRNNNTDIEEYIRNYISGYSNNMPFRFYNSFRIIIHGEDSGMTGHSTNTALTEVPTASHVDRIYRYSTEDMMNEFIDSSDIGQYIDDNFIFEDANLDSNNVVAEDFNDTWMYFENGDGTDSNFKDLITVSGMSYLADQDFYRYRMAKSYMRVKMKFMFSKKVGRWYTLDYRQSPTSYLTPTFGNVALKQKEKSVVYAESDGTELDHYVPLIQPNTSNIGTATVGADRTTLTVTSATAGISDPIFTTDEEIIVYIPKTGDIINSNPLISKTLNTTVTNDTDADKTQVSDNPVTYSWVIQLDDAVPDDFGDNVRYSKPVNSISTATYPFNGDTNGFEKSLLWQNPNCLGSQEMHTVLPCRPYYTMTPMQLNRACYPFLSTLLPYDSSGDLRDELAPEHDFTVSVDYKPTKLVYPSHPTNINFVLPNDVSGGKNSPVTFNYFAPHMWKVYWHIRPAMSAIIGTDIPSKTARTGGEMSDPVLNTMFDYPNVDSLVYHVPWHENMEIDWTTGDSYNRLILNAEVDDVGDVARIDYRRYNAEIDDPVNNLFRICYLRLDARRG